jgi:hypothetical protein
MDYVHILVAARLALADLQTADAALEAAQDLPMELVLMRHLLIGVANVADLEVTVRVLYQAHPELSALATPHRKAFEFAKYLRNISVGHLNPALAAKSLEWHPELHKTLRDNTEHALWMSSYLVLETAINTYVNDDGHRYFETETDLVLPDERQRFLNFLGETVHAATVFADKLAEIAVANGDLVDYDDKWMDLAMKAGKTEFEFITKGKR